MEKNRVQLKAVVPIAADAAHDALADGLVNAGYRVRSHAQDHDNLATFARGRIIGSWTLSRIATCDQASELTLTLGPAT